MVARISKRTPRQLVPDTDECVLSIYATNTYGYAQIRTDEYGFILHHKYEYCRWSGLHPDQLKGKILLHTCDTPACINPKHLRVGTQQDNMIDMVNKGRKAGQKLSVQDVLAIRAEYKTNDKFAEAANKYGVSVSTISNIVYRHKWKHI